MPNIKLLILVMMVVTYLPRLIPFLFVSKGRLPENLRSFLKYIPYTALGALILPGIFTATPNMPWAAMAGAVFALIYGWFRGGIIIPVMGSIIISFIVLSI